MEAIDLPLDGNKIILITGGASGIGFCLAQQAYDLGARVLVADLKTTEGFDDWVQGKDDNVLYVRTDVMCWPDLERLFEESKKKWDDVPDAYGICAGVFDPPFSNFWQDPESDSYAQVSINVSHPIKLTRLAIKHSLGTAKRASVCIVASIAGISGNIAAPLYCATKHAIVGFTKSMTASESFTGVKVTAICPGVVATPMFDAGKRTQFSYEEGKALRPGDVARQMVALLGERELGCGTVMEISLAGTRVIPEWGIEAPSAAGTGQEEGELERGLEAMLRPVKEKLRGETKGVGL